MGFYDILRNTGAFWGFEDPFFSENSFSQLSRVTFTKLKRL